MFRSARFKRKRPALANRALLHFSLVDLRFLHHGCDCDFAFAASILVFNSVCWSGVRTSLSLAIVALWSSFIFAFFCSSLSEASLDTACFFVFASAKISFTFAFWSSVRFKLSTAACKPPCIPISLPPAWGAVAACELAGAKITASAATRPNDTNPPISLLIFICGSPQFDFWAELRAGNQYTPTILIWPRREENTTTRTSSGRLPWCVRREW